MAWNPCSRWIFFMGKIDIYGWFGVFAKAMTVVGAFGQASALFKMTKQLFKDFRNRPIVEGLRSIFHEFETAPSDEIDWVGFMFACILFSFFLVTVELTIVWNGVTGVDQAGSVSQLIPIVVSVGGIGKIFQGLVKIYLGLPTEIPRMNRNYCHDIEIR